MKWYVLQLCVNLLKCSEDPRGRTLFFQIFLPYSFRLIGPQTKQGYIHPWSVKIGLISNLVKKLETYLPHKVKSIYDHEYKCKNANFLHFLLLKLNCFIKTV